MRSRKDDTCVVSTIVRTALFISCTIVQYLQYSLHAYRAGRRIIAKNAYLYTVEFVQSVAFELLCSVEYNVHDEMLRLDDYCTSNQHVVFESKFDSSCFS